MSRVMGQTRQASSRPIRLATMTMPTQPLQSPPSMRKPCIRCGKLSDQARCPTHRRKPWASTTARPKRERGYDRAWELLSLATRQRHPVCQVCGAEPSTQADHIIPLAEGGARLDPRNVQAIGDHCHRAKTQHEAARGRVA